MIRIRILLSTYNGEKYLKKQLDSIFNQDICNCEISMLVRDDGSCDDTVKILNQYKEKLNITLINDGESLGPANSFWKLLKETNAADYYAFVDQDDIWDKDKLSTAINAISKKKGRVLWFSNCRLISDDDSVIKERLHIDTPILDIPSQIICGSAQGCSMVLNYEAMEYLKSLNLDFIPMHDLVAMEFILATGQVIYENIPKFGYRVHSNNVVAKAGKSFFARKKATLNNWFGEKKRCSMIRFAGELLNNCSEIKGKDKEYLKLIVSSRSKISSRIMLVAHPLTRARSKAALRSFRVRTILGIV